MKTHRYAAQARIATPLGSMTAAATDSGLAGLWFDAQSHHPGAIDAPTDDTQPFIALARRELDLYWLGALSGQFSVPLDPQGTAFQRRVWRTLCGIAAGQTCSYSEVARAAAAAGAARAVGAAIGRNPIGVIVPCHRVLGRDGSLTGYAGGLARKQALLQMEGALGATGR